jgi:hypothetical protein
MRIEDVIGANGLPQRTTKTCANCMKKAICTLSQVTGGGGAGENTLLVSRWTPVWLCKVCRRRNLRDDDAPQVIAAATTAAAVKDKSEQMRDGIERLFCAARRVNGPIDES